MFHEDLQADVVGEDGLTLSARTVPSAHVSRRRVEFREQEPGLGTTGVAHDVSWNRESVRDEFLCGCGRSRWVSEIWQQMSPLAEWKWAKS